MVNPHKTMGQAREALRSHEGDERFSHEVEEMKQEKDLEKIDDDVEAEATLIEWNAEEHAHQPKGVWWYVGLIVVTVVLLGAFWFLGNYFGMALVVISAGLLLFMVRRDPVNRRYRLMVHGIAINNVLYHYKDLDAFNIIYEPDDVKVLLVKGKRTLTPLLALELGEIDPVEVRDVMLEFVEEDQEIEEPFADVLFRRLGF